MRLAPFAIGAIAITAVAVLSGALGYRVSSARWEKVERERAEAIVAERERQAHEMAQLHRQIDELQSRPARVRTVTKEVVKYVQADAQCSSLPASVRSLWNADPNDPAPTSAAGVGDAGLRPLAADVR